MGTAAWLGWRLENAPAVHAGEEWSIDSDGDGLHDELELVLGTSPFRADTDRDGYSDGEEIARRSSPRRTALVPQGGPSVAMNAYAKDGRVHALTTVYLPDGVLSGRTVRFGLELNGQLLTVPLATLRGGEPPRVEALPNGGALVIFDPVVPEAFIQARGGLAMFVTVASGGQYLAADAMTLVLSVGEVFQHVAPNGLPVSITEGLQASTPVGGIYRPLTAGGGSSNSTHITGQVCAQTTMIIGAVGALVTQEVVDARCVEGWDAHCSAGCVGTIGMTIRSIDPAALIGG